MSYSASKYDSPTDDVLYNTIMFGWDTDWSGESDYGLWFSQPVEVTKTDATQSSALREALADIDSLTITEQFQTIQSFPGVWIAASDDRGFCYCWKYDSLADAQAEYDKLEAAYFEWTDQDSDD